MGQPSGEKKGGLTTPRKGRPKKWARRTERPLKREKYLYPPIGEPKKAPGKTHTVLIPELEKGPWGEPFFPPEGPKKRKWGKMGKPQVVLELMPKIGKTL